MKFPAPARKQSVPRLTVVPLHPAKVLRREQLRNQLPDIVDALRRRRADLVPEGFIAEYVTLEWVGGALRATVTGANICKQMPVKPV